MSDAGIFLVISTLARQLLGFYFMDRYVILLKYFADYGKV